MANNNQSAINLQQQQDLMQVAALMFPSLFMAQQSNNQGSLLAHQSFIQNLQVQQQQQQFSEQTKLLENLVSQNQTYQNSNDWLKILNEQSNNNPSSGSTNGASNHRQATIIQNNKNKINHMTSNGSKSQSNKRNIISKTMSLNNTSLSSDPKKALNNTNGANNVRSSGKIISQLQQSKNNSNHISSICNGSKPSSSSSPGPTQQQQHQQKKQGSSVFSIKDLIGGAATTNTKKTEVVEPVVKKSEDKTNNYLEYLLLVQKQQEQQEKSNRKSSSPILINEHSNQTNGNNNNAFGQTNSTDTLLMFAAAAAAMQNSSTNNFFSANQHSNHTNNNSINSYDWLMQIANQQQQQEQPDKPQAFNNKSSTCKIESSESCVASSSFKQSKSSIVKINSLNLNGSHHKQEKMNSTVNVNDNCHETNFEIYEGKIKAPLKHGWRRETILKEIHKNGVKGDVIYYSPCGKKLRTFQEIERYLNKYEKDMEQKGTKLGRENFTFSSKILLGAFLNPKDHSLASSLIENGDESNPEDKLKKELSFDILSEEEIMAKILALNPNFRLNGSGNTKPPGQMTIKNMSESLMGASVESHQIKSSMPTVLKLENTFTYQHNGHLNNKSSNQELTSNIYDFASMSTNEQVFKEQMNSRFEKHHQEQQELKEQQRQEKFLLRERKSREKWFEYILAREQNPSNQRHINQFYMNNEIPEIFDSSNKTAFDTIDDMQEKFCKPMPEFKSFAKETESTGSGLEDTGVSTRKDAEAETNKGWLADSIQVIEFLVTFSDKLKESLIESDNNNASKIEAFDTVLSSLEQFRQGIENKSEKLKREIIQIVQLLLKCLLNTITQEADTPSDNKSIVDTSSKDYYLINKLKNIECTDLTYSEILRLYIKRSFIFMEARRKLTANKFDIDVTAGLHNQLTNYLDKLSANTFEYLEPELKVSILAYLCDELLSTSPIEDLNNLHNQELIDYDNLDDYSCVVYDLNDAIDEFHTLKQEICQLDSKRRQLKTERSVANVKLNSITGVAVALVVENGEQSSLPPTSIATTATAEVSEKERLAQQKCVTKLDKALAQLEKKRAELKNDLDKCSNRLRSGKHLGQDRYLRNYWSLNTTGAILIQASEESTAPGSMYYSGDSEMLVANPAELDVKEIVDELLDRVVDVREDELKCVDKYAHVIERHAVDNPFRISLNVQHPDVTKLSFRQLEQLVRDHIQHKRPQRIDGKYLNERGSKESKWWLCDNEVLFKQLVDCLSKRGYREKDLLKNLCKFNEEYLHLLPSSWTDEAGIEAKEAGESNQVFGKLKNMLKDFSGEDACSSGSKKQRDIQVYREQMKVLKYVYALEDRVFSANLQQAASKDKPLQQAARKHLDDNGSDSSEREQPIDVAVERLRELEQRIERRYLKYPFVPKKKLTHLKKKLLLKRKGEEEEADGENSQGGAEDEGNSTRDAEEESEEAGQESDEPVVTKELQKWRELTASCKTTAQLYILVDELNNSIAWDKSIMKVICQICNSDSNEDKLLLCDNCDKGNHTYCFKPQLDEIPDGDWYCFVCIGILSDGQKLCCVCGSNESFCPYEAINPRGTTNDLNKCDKCAKCFHGQCMPQAKNYKTTRKWNCLNCSNTKPIISKVLKQNLQLNNSEKSKENEINGNNKRNGKDTDKKSVKKLKKEEPLPVTVSVKKTNNVVATNGTNKESLLKKSLTKNNKTSNKRKEIDTETEHNSSIDESHSESKFNSSEQENNSVVSVASSAKTSKKSDAKNTNKGGAAAKKIAVPEMKPATESLEVNLKQMVVSSPPATPPNHVVKQRDMNMCLTIINEMAKTEAAKHFLAKVDEGKFPGYYKTIKYPMDINTIKEKLKDKAYKTKEQFAYDCRLIFDNCEFFNEDNSKVGLAGHKLRAYFETKWMKVFD